MARLPRTASSDRCRPRPGCSIFQALSAWTVLEATGQTEQLATDFQAWLLRILDEEIPYVRRISKVKASIPKH